MPPHGGHSCVGDSKHDDTPEMGVEYSLYSKIDLQNLECLNEASEGSGKNVFKPWEDRLNFDTVSHQLFSLSSLTAWFFSASSLMRMKSFYSTYRSPATSNSKGLLWSAGTPTRTHPRWDCIVSLTRKQTGQVEIWTCRFKNRPHMTFDDIHAAPEQEFEMQMDANGSLEYSTKYLCNHLCIPDVKSLLLLE